MNKDQYNYTVFKKWIRESMAKAKGVVDDKYITSMEKGLIKMDDVVEKMKKDMAEGKFLHLFANASPLQRAFTALTHGWMQLWGLTVASPKMKELTAGKKGDELEALLADNNEAAFYTGRVLSGQFMMGAEFQKFFGLCDYILSGDASVIKASDKIFTGALAE
jgi:hypothetical protein